MEKQVEKYEDKKTIIGEVEDRGKCRTFGIWNADKSRHMYIIGKSGTGKSTLLESMAIQDMNNGAGIFFMDPHGQSVENLLNYIPEDRKKDVLYFNPKDLENPIALNIMEDVGADRRHLVASSLMSAFVRIWGENQWSDRMINILNNTLLALLEYPNTTLLDISRMYSDENFRNSVVASITDIRVKYWWTDVFARYTREYVLTATPAIDNKISQFTSNPVIRNIIAQPKSSFSIRKHMDEGKIVLINLSKGLIGDTNTKLLGSLISTKIYLSALERADLSPSELEKTPFCNFYIDEFQSFAAASFDEILSEARKYKLNLILAHQFIRQLTDEIRDSVFGNVGSMLAFRVGPEDAYVLERQFAGVVTAADILNLKKYHMYISLCIDNMGEPAFGAKTFPIPPLKQEHINTKQEVVEYSRKTYGKKRKYVEELIISKHTQKPVSKKNPKKKLDMHKIKDLLAKIDLNPPDKSKTINQQIEEQILSGKNVEEVIANLIKFKRYELIDFAEYKGIEINGKKSATEGWDTERGIITNLYKALNKEKVNAEGKEVSESEEDPTKNKK